MILPGCKDDPIIWLDSRKTFRGFLQNSFSDEELLELARRQVNDSSLRLSPAANAVVADALSWLTAHELVEQIELNVQERLDWPGYEQWCREQLECMR